jgi:hypothetical protein
MSRILAITRADFGLGYICVIAGQKENHYFYHSLAPIQFFLLM